MPTLVEALPIIGAAATGPPSRVETGSEGLAPFEAMAAAVLSLHVGPTSGSAVIDALRDEGLLDPAHLDEAELPEIQDALRGKPRSFSVKTLAPLKHLARWLVRRFGGRAESLLDPDLSTSDLRDELASLKGMGMSGADAILLLALRRPSFPVDRGSFRILVRHDWLDASAGYDEARDLVVHHAGGDPDLLTRVSDGMEELARRFCHPAAPHCDGCPLERLLPEGGPRGAEE
jgi:endonuclease-3 related protein